MQDFIDKNDSLPVGGGSDSGILAIVTEDAEHADKTSLDVIQAIQDHKYPVLFDVTLWGGIFRFYMLDGTDDAPIALFIGQGDAMTYQLDKDGNVSEPF